MKKVLAIFFLLLMTALVFSGCTPQKELDAFAETVKEDIVLVLEENGITEYTIGPLTKDDGEHLAQANFYYIVFDIPSFDSMDEETKLNLIGLLCRDDCEYLGEGYSDENCYYIQTKVVSNGNEYKESFTYGTYYKNGSVVVVKEKTTEKDGGNYNKNDSYYSSNDYNNDGELNASEFYGAVDDYMSDHGY